MAEVWKIVPSKFGLLASSFGRVKLPVRFANMPNGGQRTYKTKPTYGVVRRAKKGAAHSYMAIHTRFWGNLKIHQAVCEAFHGPKPFPDAKVLHRDENGQNNRPENLYWGTQKENLIAEGSIAYCKSRTGQNSTRAKWVAKRQSA